jgi:hypothetical protein
MELLWESHLPTMSTRPKAARKRKNDLPILFKMNLWPEVEPVHIPFLENAKHDADMVG